MKNPAEISFKAYIGDVPQFSEWELERWFAESQMFRGLNVDIIMRVHSPKATREQFGYYRAVVLPFITAQLKMRNGYSRIDEKTVHDYLKANLARLVFPQTIEPLILPSSTARLSIDGFTNFLQRCDEFCLDWIGCSLPGLDETQGLRIRYSGEL